MQFVGAAFLHGADDATGRVAVFSWRQSGDDFHFRHRIQNRLCGFRAGSLIIAVHAIFKNADSARALASQMITAQAAPISVTGGGHARDQIQSRVDEALIQWQVIKNLARNHAPSCRGFSFQQRRRAGHFHRFRYITHLQRNIHRKRIAGAKFHCFVSLLEARPFKRNPVLTRLQRQDAVYAVTIGHAG